MSVLFNLYAGYQMAKKWSGDGTYFLPARQIEPYRLWFEFLKLAHVDPEIEVDYEYYSEWGAFWEMPFNEWWTEARWKKLFSVDSGVRVLLEGEVCSEEPHAIIVRLPLNKPPSDTLQDVAELLKQNNAGVKFGQVRQGRYSMTDGYEKAFLKYLDRANMMLRLYGLWLNNSDLSKSQRVTRTALQFYDWAEARKTNIRERRYQYTEPTLPFALKSFALELKAGENMSGSDERRAFMRYIKKAKALAQNASSGKFPGKW